MTEDGWRPILGTGREPTSFQHHSSIVQRKIPGTGNDVKVEIVKSNPIPFSSTFPPLNKFTGESTNAFKNEQAQYNGGE